MIDCRALCLLQKIERDPQSEYGGQCAGIPVTADLNFAIMFPSLNP